MNLKLNIWRQSDKDAKGGMVNYSIEDVSPDMSFLEM
jgi:succinate dehydrogenase / fumarate reductase iron-sulfur subunit